MLTLTLADEKNTNKGILHPEGNKPSQNFDMNELQAQLENHKLATLDLSVLKTIDEMVEPNYRRTLCGRTTSTSALCASKIGWVASGSVDHAIEIFDLKTNKFLALLKEHKGAIRALAETKDGMLLSGADDHTIKLWHPQNFKCLNTFLGHTEAVNTIIVLSTMAFVSGSSDGTVRIWDITTNKCKQILNFNNSLYWQIFNNDIWALAILPDGLLVVSSTDGYISLWNTNSWQQHARFRDNHLAGKPRKLVVSSDGYLVSQCIDYSDDSSTLSFWNIKNKYLKSSSQIFTEMPYRTYREYRTYGHSMVTLPYGQVVSASKDNLIRICSLRMDDYTHKPCIKMPKYGNQLAVTADNELLVGDDNGKIHVFSTNFSSFRALQITDITLLMPVLKSNRSLTRLSLDHISLERLDDFSRLLDALILHPTLMSLSLQNCGIHIQGLNRLSHKDLIAYANCFHDLIACNNKLTELDLSSNTLGGSNWLHSSGMELLANALLKNKTLTKIRLVKVWFNAKDALLLLNACKLNLNIIEIEFADLPCKVAAASVSKINNLLMMRQKLIPKSGLLISKDEYRISLERYKNWLRKIINQFIQEEVARYGYLHPERQAVITRIRVIIAEVKNDVAVLNNELSEYLKTLGIGGFQAFFSNYYDNAPLVGLLQNSLLNSNSITDEITKLEVVRDIPVSAQGSSQAVLVAMQQEISKLQAQMLELKQENMHCRARQKSMQILALLPSAATTAASAISDEKFMELISQITILQEENAKKDDEIEKLIAMQPGRLDDSKSMVTIIPKVSKVDIKALDACGLLKDGKDKNVTVVPAATLSANTAVATNPK